MPLWNQWHVDQQADSDSVWVLISILQTGEGFIVFGGVLIKHSPLRKWPRWLLHSCTCSYLIFIQVSHSTLISETWTCTHNSTHERQQKDYWERKELKFLTQNVPSKKHQQTYSFFQYHPPKVAREIVQFFNGLLYTNMDLCCCSIL